MLQVAKVISYLGYSKGHSTRTYKVRVPPYGAEYKAVFLADSAGAQMPLKIGMRVLIAPISHIGAATMAILKVYYRNNIEHGEDDIVLYTADGNVYLGDGKQADMDFVMCYAQANADMLQLQAQIDEIAMWAAGVKGNMDAPLAPPFVKVEAIVADGGKAATNVKVKPKE